MNNAPTIVDVLQPETLERVLIGGNLKTLTPNERLQYYKAYCETLSLNPITRPFDYIEFQGRLTLYANKGCAEQLRQIRKVSITITSREVINDVYVVTARAKLPDGREDESTGAVAIAGLKGNDLANMYLKTETKAKRRVTLSICGLNMLDETEAETIKDARKVSIEEAETEQQKESPKPPVAPPISGDEFVPDSLIEHNADDPGDYVVPFSKNYRGKKLKDIGLPHIQGFVHWLEEQAEIKKEPLSDNARFLKVAVERYERSLMNGGRP